jgi:hypothetical protein
MVDRGNAIMGSADPETGVFDFVDENTARAKWQEIIEVGDKYN